MRTDLGLREDVLRSLAVEPSLDDASIGVTVHDGVVGLHGTVDSYARKHAAERAAGRVCGRCVLADGRRVALPDACRSSDAELARPVLAAVRGVTGVRGLTARLDGDPRASLARGHATGAPRPPPG